MTIDVNTKINEFLLNIKQNNARLVEDRIGREAINRYLSDFSEYDDIFTHTLPYNKLNIENYGFFQLLKLTDHHSELILLVKDNKAILKMISIKGLIYIKNSEKDIFNDNKINFIDTDLYINDDVVVNVINKDENGNIITESYSSMHESNNNIHEQLNDLNHSVNVKYENDLPSDIEFKYRNRVLDNKKISNELGFDIETDSGRIQLISEINENFNIQLKELEDFLFDRVKDVQYTKRK